MSDPKPTTAEELRRLADKIEREEAEAKERERTRGWTDEDYLAEAMYDGP